MDTERFHPDSDDLADNLIIEQGEPTDIDILELEREAESILGEALEQEPIAPPEPKTKTRKRKPEKNNSEKSEACVHHWIVETPVDGISHGTCKNCKAEKGFDHNKAFGGTWDKISRRKYEEVQRRNRDEKGRFLL